MKNLTTYIPATWTSGTGKSNQKEERTVETLEATVRNIFKIIKHMEHEVWYKYPQAVKKLPEDIYFITSQELEDMYPDKTQRKEKI